MKGQAEPGIVFSTGRFALLNALRMMEHGWPGALHFLLRPVDPSETEHARISGGRRLKIRPAMRTPSLARFRNIPVRSC
jgi:hypothetical protein